jgi:catechol 2,3-dioxygenase-like lactoylglutathione lyase family enzyme/ribosomal protein S18 acetylase RimI-like enzyme
MRTHHVQLTIPAGKERIARGFYAGLLGMEEMEKPATLALHGGCWFRQGDFELHLGAEDHFVPADRGHPGVLVDDIDALAARLEAGNITPIWDEHFPGHRRFYIHDPFGNRLEFLSAIAGDDAIRVERLEPDTIDTWRTDIVSIYAEAFADPPYNRGATHVDGFADALRSHVDRPGFVAFCACVGHHLVGFTYGYTTGRNHWWHEQVRAALGTHADHWLTDSFEYVELALMPRYRRLRIGRRLHDALLAAQPHPRAVLSTIDAVTAGRRLYESAGWKALVRGFRFERTVARYVIMGLEPVPGTQEPEAVLTRS